MNRIKRRMKRKQEKSTQPENRTPESRTLSNLLDEYRPLELDAADPPCYPPHEQ